MQTVATKKQTFSTENICSSSWSIYRGNEGFKIALASTGVGLLIIGIGVLVSQIMGL